MLKLLADENIARDLVQWLRDQETMKYFCKLLKPRNGSFLLKTRTSASWYFATI